MQIQVHNISQPAANAPVGKYIMHIAAVNHIFHLCCCLGSSESLELLTHDLATRHV